MEVCEVPHEVTRGIRSPSICPGSSIPSFWDAQSAERFELRPPGQRLPLPALEGREEGGDTNTPVLPPSLVWHSSSAVSEPPAEEIMALRSSFLLHTSLQDLKEKKGEEKKKREKKEKEEAALGPSERSAPSQGHSTPAKQPSFIGL